MSFHRKTFHAASALLAAAFLATIAPSAIAAPGDRDPAFGANGLAVGGLDVTAGANPAAAMALEPDTGKVVIAGSDGSQDVDAVVARYLPDGSLDPSFGGDGKAQFGFVSGDDSAHAVAVQDDGKIVIAGLAENAGTKAFAVARLEADGDADPTFGNGGRRIITFTESSGDDLPASVALDGNRIVVAGQVMTASSGARAAIVRLTAGGDLDSSFSGDGRRVVGTANGQADDAFMDVAVQADGRPVATGVSQTADGYARISTWRFTENGLVDASFDGDGQVFTTFAEDGAPANEWARALALDGDRIVLAGVHYLPTTPAVAVARLTPDGQPDPSFSDDGRALPMTDLYANTADVVVDGGGRVLALTPSEPHDTGLVRLTSDGRPDSSFADDGVLQTDLFPSGQDAVRALALSEDGRMLIAGGVAANSFVARLLGGDRPPPPSASTGPTPANPTSPKPTKPTKPPAGPGPNGAKGTGPAEPRRRCANRIRGTRRRDVLRGTTGSDRLVGGRGNDVMRAGAGSDCLEGGGGNDVMSGGSGRNSYRAGKGSDRIKARNGRADRIDCGPGRDVVFADRSDRLRRCERKRRRAKP